MREYIIITSTCSAIATLTLSAFLLHSIHDKEEACEQAQIELTEKLSPEYNKAKGLISGDTKLSPVQQLVYNQANVLYLQGRENIMTCKNLELGTFQVQEATKDLSNLSLELILGGE